MLRSRHNVKPQSAPLRVTDSVRAHSHNSPYRIARTTNSHLDADEKEITNA